MCLTHNAVCILCPVHEVDMVRTWTLVTGKEMVTLLILVEGGRGRGDPNSGHLINMHFHGSTLIKLYNDDFQKYGE